MSKRSLCIKNAFQNYKNIKNINELCCPHKMVKATRWGKINDTYYVKTCCSMCKDKIKEELKKGDTGKYRIRDRKFLQKYNPKTKRFSTVFKLLKKSEI